MNRKQGIGIGIALLLLGLVWALWRETATSPTANRDMEPSASIGVAATGDLPAPPDAAASEPRLSIDGAAPGPAIGTLVVQVYRAPDLPVSGVRVVAGRDTATTGVDGRAVLRLPAQPCEVRLDFTSLPRGLTAPLQDTTAPRGAPDGFFARAVEVVADRRVTLRLRVFAAATMNGIVVDDHGLPVADCMVRLQHRRAELVGIACDATTAADGSFRIADVPPGNYQLSAFPTGEMLPPPARRLEIFEGERSPMAPIVLNTGRGTMRGRIVDQDGVPLAGVPVQVYPDETEAPDGGRPYGLGDDVSRATTDADGAFVCRHVPALRVKVQGHAEGSLLQDGDPNRLQQPMQSVPVDMSTRTEVDLGELRALRSHPYRIDVNIDIDHDAVRRADPSGRKRDRAPEIFVVGEDAVNDRQQWRQLGSDKNDSYHWRCETPHAAILIIVRHRWFPEQRRRLEPRPDGHDVVGLELPAKQ